MSAKEFARRTGTSADRVLRYLDAWIEAAQEGIVAHTVELTPADWNDPEHLPTGYQWTEFYTSVDGTARNIRCRTPRSVDRRSEGCRYRRDEGVGRRVESEGRCCGHVC